MERHSRQMRCQTSEFNTRSLENGDLFIEGYFAIFNSNYELWEGASESILPGAFDDCLSDDVRALIDHESRLVLGRTTSKTLTLTQDEKGLFGSIKINQDDVDAMNLYSRVKRGDVNQCSFGFDIGEQKEEVNEEGQVHWTIVKVKPLYEVSCVTFPAYEDTSITARKNDFKQIEKRRLEAWKISARKKIKKEVN